MYTVEFSHEVITQVFSYSSACFSGVAKCSKFYCVNCVCACVCVCMRACVCVHVRIFVFEYSVMKSRHTEYSSISSFGFSALHGRNAKCIKQTSSLEIPQA